ncbi:MAG: hypothetical protein ACRDF5_07405 [bacterium]
MSRYLMRYRSTQDLSREWVIEQDAPSAADLAQRVREAQGAIYILQLEEAKKLKRLAAASQGA